LSLSRLRPTLSTEVRQSIVSSLASPPVRCFPVLATKFRPQLQGCWRTLMLACLQPTSQLHRLQSRSILLQAVGRQQGVVPKRISSAFASTFVTGGESRAYRQVHMSSNATKFCKMVALWSTLVCQLCRRPAPITFVCWYCSLQAVAELGAGSLFAQSSRKTKTLAVLFFRV
jgi:hypothetical protein